jgi:hypothetical protein
LLYHTAALATAVSIRCPTLVNGLGLTSRKRRYTHHQRRHYAQTACLNFHDDLLMY